MAFKIKMEPVSFVLSYLMVLYPPKREVYNLWKNSLSHLNLITIRLLDLL